MATIFVWCVCMLVFGSSHNSFTVCFEQNCQPHHGSRLEESLQLPLWHLANSVSFCTASNKMAAPLLHSHLTKGIQTRLGSRYRPSLQSNRSTSIETKGAEQQSVSWAYHVFMLIQRERRKETIKHCGLVSVCSAAVKTCPEARKPSWPANSLYVRWSWSLFNSRQRVS